MDFSLPKEIEEKRKKVREFALREFTEEKKRYYDEHEKFPFEIWEKGKKEGIFTVGNPWEQLITIEELFRVDPGLGSSILTSAFGAEVLMLFGNEFQKKKYLEPVLRGEKIMGFAVTEPVAGSDVAGIASRIEKQDGYWLLNGTKMFITNGTIADFLVTLARSGPPPSEQKRHHNMTMAIVETNWPGVSRNKIYGKLGVRATDTAEIVFNNVKVPDENIIGEVGKGFYYAMTFFDISRIYTAIQAVGIAEGAVDMIMDKIRKDEKLSSMESVQFTIAEIMTKVEAARLLTYEAASYLFEYKPDPTLTSMAKYFAGDVATFATEKALEIAGIDGAISSLERLFRDSKIMEIWEGSTEIEKLTIYRSYIRKVMQK
ncbi:MAG: acyl-CoA dehydrogenase family protein [Caldisphaera sp.]|jgi:acyl-CoA dehydrogenase|nr:acyl-CoA dehydrogenase family protein [Caldisphaera sp.]